MRTTFVFGAGASAEEGAATGSQVLEKAFKILKGPTADKRSERLR